MSIYRPRGSKSGWDLIQKTSFALLGTLAHVWSSILNDKETNVSIYKYTIFDFVDILSLGS